MQLQTVIDYCTSRPGSTQEFPFDDTTLVFKIKGKMFALISLDEPHRINLKCDPAYALVLRQQYPQVRPGYHMNKKHWNTIELDGTVTDENMMQWIDDSYELVIRKLPEKD